MTYDLAHKYEGYGKNTVRWDGTNSNTKSHEHEMYHLW